MLREIDVPPLTDPFVARASEKYARLLAQLRKTFEVLRGEDKRLKRQLGGDDIDFDARTACDRSRHPPLGATSGSSVGKCLVRR